MTSPAGSSRAAFTAIELTIALGVMVALSGMTTQAVLSSLRAHQVNVASDAIEAAAATARQLAIRAHAINAVAPSRDPGFAGKRYGVLLLPPADGRPAAIAVTWGATAEPRSLWQQDGVEAHRSELPVGVQLLRRADDGSLQPLTAPLGWCYQHGTGIACRDAASGSALSFIGGVELAAAIVDVRPPLRLSETILIATPDGRIANELTLLPSGDLLIARR